MSSDEKVRILLVDDRPENLLALCETLGPLGQNLVTASTGQEALRQLFDHDFAVVVLDVQLPDMNGFEVAGVARGRERSRLTPIIFLTATHMSDVDAFRGFEAGGVDYMFKPFVPEILRAKVTVFVDLFRMQQELERANETLEQRVAERTDALKESEERYRQLVEMSPDAIFVHSEGRLVSANPAAVRLFGATAPEDLIGRPVLDFVHPDFLEIVRESIRRLMEEREDVSVPKQKYIRLDGKVIDVEVNANPFTYQGRPAAIAVVRDVTEHEQVLERAQQQDRLAAVGQLAAGIAHDFNNLLTGVIGFAQLLEIRQDIPASAKEDLGKIVSQGQRAAQMIRQVLDFSRKTAAKRQVLDLVPFLKETMKLLERTLQENIHLKLEVGTGRCIVDANLTQLQQVITNLVVNARDAMPEGGELRIGFSHLRVEGEEKPPLPEMKAGAWVAWTVSDTGMGMPPEVLRHIFEPFFTTKEVGKGTGLGLAQVYGIVQQHGGHIDVKSEVGEGTAFTIYLPLVEKTETSSRQAAAEFPRGREETILVVEDQAEVLLTARRMLESLNYRVLTATNGAEALDLYGQNQDRIALVLTDMVMPGMSVTELFERLKEKTPGVRVAVMSGYSLGEMRNIQRFPGILGWLEKPLVLGQVAQVINAALKGEGPDSAPNAG